MIKVIVDTLGGDNPKANIEGGLRAIMGNSDLEVIFVGDSDMIYSTINELDLNYDISRVSIYNAPDEISCNDKPTDAIRFKKDSSLYQAIEMLKNNDDINALVTTGSTGAVIAGAVLKIGRIKGIKRPALCPILPTMNGGIVAICDSGANVECDSENLYQFALMASLYMQKANNVKKPRVALLNVGEEEEKGDRIRKETYEKLKANANINFVGNMESRDLLSGDYDVVISDGFSGNVLLKSTEGACLSMMKMLKDTFTKSAKNKLGALILKKDLKKMKNFMDYNNYGGAVLLGCKKTVVKSHGASKASAVYHSINLAYNMEKNRLRDEIEQSIKV